MGQGAINYQGVKGNKNLEFVNSIQKSYMVAPDNQIAAGDFVSLAADSDYLNVFANSSNSHDIAKKSVSQLLKIW